MSMSNETQIAADFGSIRGIALTLVGGTSSIYPQGQALLDRLEKQIKSGAIDTSYALTLLAEVRKQTNNIYNIANRPH
jgi:hypothetical protein